MTTKPLILLFGTMFLLGKGSKEVEQRVPDGEELFSGGFKEEGFEGFEGRQLSSLVGSAPWLQGAGHLLRLFGEARLDDQQVFNHNFCDG